MAVEIENLRDVLRQLVKQGTDPNELQTVFNQSVGSVAHPYWELFSTGHWFKVNE